MICDISKYQGTIDWDKLALELDFVVIKASGRWASKGDPRYVENVAGAVAHGVPFHAYHYIYSLTEAEARLDAGLFYRIVSKAGRWPLFWVLDCEAGWGVANARARPIAEAFEAELRRLARASLGAVGSYAADQSIALQHTNDGKLAVYVNGARVGTINYDAP